MIEIRNLRRHLPSLDRPLLDIDQWAIDAGDAIALRGATGSGKTSLLRAIAMIDPCPGCELRFHDQSVTADSITSFRRQVIYLPQRAVVLPATVEENLRLPFSSQVDSQAYSQQRAVQLLEQFAKPAEFLDKPAENLSGGERQIVSFVRAIQLDPDVLLLDEPTSALDRESAQRLEQVLGQWYETTGRNGIRRAFVLVSHQTEQLTRLTQQSVTIANGQLK